MLVLSLLGCVEPLDADSAVRWAHRRETTLQSTDLAVQRLVRKLPSLPGDQFGCHDLTIPPGIPEADQEPMRANLCRQREQLWIADRHDAEEDLGTAFLNTELQSYGAVGVELVIAGPQGLTEWSDHRGIWGLGGEHATPAERGVDWSGAKLGWGEVTVPLAEATLSAAALHPALEWRLEKPWHQATVTVRLLLLADGTPDAKFVGQATNPTDEPGD